MSISGNDNDAFSIPGSLSGNGVSPDAFPARDDEIDSFPWEDAGALTVSGNSLPAMEGTPFMEEAAAESGTVQEWMEAVLASEKRQEAQLEAVTGILLWILVGCVLYGLYRFLRIFF